MSAAYATFRWEKVHKNPGKKRLFYLLTNGRKSATLKARGLFAHDTLLKVAVFVQSVMQI